MCVVDSVITLIKTSEMFSGSPSCVSPTETINMFNKEANKDKEKPEKEAIHSGHFMVSHFEAEAQDDEDELAVPVPEVNEPKHEIVTIKPNKEKYQLQRKNNHRPQIGIDTSLSKLFQCMSLAYRQKLTSPKWNRFRGIRLRWKDKIRLNNVIWRCWHMQFIKKQNTLICQFASPLDVDTHNKPEAVVLEGKYWKRKLAAVTAEYKKWRMFYRNQTFGHSRDTTDMLTEMELLAWHSQAVDESMMVDEDYMGLMSDTLFSTIGNQPFQFPDTREIAKAGLADFIQPSLGPLQPNLDDYMDTFEPFHELLSGKLATVPEENTNYNLYKHVNWDYPNMVLMSNQNVQMLASNNVMDDYGNTIHNIDIKSGLDDNRQIQQYSSSVQNYNGNSSLLYNSSDMISKNMKPMIDVTPLQKLDQTYPTKNIQNTFSAFPQGVEVVTNSLTPDIRLQTPTHDFKLNHSPTEDMGYKFMPPATPNPKFASSISQSVKFTSQKEDKAPTRGRGIRGRPRSRSNTREPTKKPPLISAASDPSLLNSSNSALLTQLLTKENNSFMQQNQRVTNSHDNIRIKDEMQPIPILPQPSATTLIITTPVNITPMHANLNDPLLLNTMSASNSPILENNPCLNSPTSSQGSMGSPTRDPQNRDQRRVGHIHAEQKRRYNIKNGFDMIHSLIPQLNKNPNAKLSKAAMLQKGAEYIKQLRVERNSIKNEMDNLRQEIDTLNASISNCQSLLPATGAPVSRRRDNKMQEMFDEYVRSRTLEDWKFWIFSLLFRPLLASFNNFVSTSSREDLYRSTLNWIEQHCTLVDLRPVVLNSLRYLCTKTDILSEPEKLPDEAQQIVLSKQNQQSM